jgi:tetratricopeptide (TPR) repeat protein
MSVTFKPIPNIAISIKKGCIALFFCCLFSVLSFSQNQRIDSLNSLISTSSGSELSDVFYELALENLYLAQYNQTIKFGEMAYHVGAKSNDSLRMVKGEAIKASGLRRSGILDSARNLYLKVLPIARRNFYNEELLAITNSLGLLYLHESRYDLALEYLFESLVLREQKGNKFDISVALQNIGLVYYKLEDSEKALSFYFRSLSLRRQSGNLLDVDVLLLNIALCHINNDKNYQEGQNFIDQAFQECDKLCSKNFLLSAYFAQGNLFFRKREFNKAESFFLKSYDLAVDEGNIRYQLDNLVALSEIYLLWNQTTRAKTYLERAEKVLESDSRFSLELSDVYSQFIRLYEREGMLGKLTRYQKKYIQIKDSIFGRSLTSNLMKVQANHLEREHNIQIESQHKILALNEQIIYRQRILNITIGAIALLILLLAILLAKSNKQKRKVNQLLDTRVRERTKELELNRDKLERAWLERDAIINRASIDIRSSIATIKGLCLLGMKDIDHPNAKDYFSKVDTTSDRLSGVISRIFRPYRADAG